MSTYPGNSSLSTAVKERVVSTFQQTLALYRTGQTDQVVAGCNLILQMDPLFDPAKKLLEKTRNPALPIDVERLLPTTTADALQQAKQAMAAREFERVVQLTTEILTNDLMNDEARILSDEAREKIEAAPFIDQFIRKCEQHVNAGNLSAARTDLEKARALDAGHPGLARIAQLISSKEASAPPSDASSFVVDTPATPAARGTAQAADFGFTFEEDKQQGSAFANFSFDTPAAAAPGTTAPAAGGFSFDAPPATPPPAAPSSFDFNTPAKEPASGEFDFSTASIETSPDDQKKVEQYLADGDRAFAAGDDQKAIEAWSQVFLIDVTSEAASERIEKAKARRRESEQRVEGAFAAGVEAFNRKDYTTARTRFQEVLASDPTNSDAREYLDRIETASTPIAIPPSAKMDSVLDEESFGSEEALVPPAPAPAAAKKSAPKATPSSARKPMPLLLGGVLAAVLLLGGGWFLWSRMSEPAADPGATQAVLNRASSLGSQGKFDEAITILRDIQPGDSQYDTALAMIADLQQKKARAATMIDGKPLAVYFDENLAAGQAAFAAHDYVGAKRAFENAMRVKPLPPDAKQAYDTAAQQAAKLESARQFFSERKYADAIAALEPLLNQDPQNQNIRRMITDAHFNLGALALQNEQTQEALRQFDAVLRVDPNDELAKRSRELAVRYEKERKDLLYRIYVKYLPLRQPPA